MKKIVYIIICLVLVLLSVQGCKKNTKSKVDTKEKKIEKVEKKEKQIIVPMGNTLETRIETPKNYTREQVEDTSLGAFLRRYEMKDDGSQVMLYDGTYKKNQDAHVAIFKLPLENYDLQQCADSIIRVYAEYFWYTKQYKRISFHFVNGFEAKYAIWVKGYKIKKFVNDVTWLVDESANDSYESFKEYLQMVFCYASTISMDKEAIAIEDKDISIGDIFIVAGRPGHAVMVVDTCVNAEGNKAFLLAQGFMPAQEFQVLKNPQHPNDPWYYLDELSYPFRTPEYTFQQGSLKRPQY